MPLSDTAIERGEELKAMGLKTYDALHVAWSMKLPNADNAVIPTEKLRDYLLLSSHPVGGFKAVFFRALGYTDNDWERLEADIRSMLTNYVTVGEQTDSRNARSKAA